MKGEIDGDFYCSRFQHPAITCSGFNLCKGRKTGCECLHRKWPTPGQYLEEYGGKYPNDGAVYFYRKTCLGKDGYDWFETAYWFAFPLAKDREKQIVCACTPWGKPPAAWRPE